MQNLQHGSKARTDFDASSRRARLQRKLFIEAKHKFLLRGYRFTVGLAGN